MADFDSSQFAPTSAGAGRTDLRHLSQPKHRLDNPGRALDNSDMTTNHASWSLTPAHHAGLPSDAPPTDCWRIPSAPLALALSPEALSRGDHSWSIVCCLLSSFLLLAFATFRPDGFADTTPAAPATQLQSPALRQPSQARASPAQSALSPGNPGNPAETNRANPNLQLGLVSVYPANRSLSFPAVVNMVAGPVEYLVVHNNGKLHESIFATEAQPAQIHAAALLLHKRTNLPPVEISVIHEAKTNTAAALIRCIADKRPFSPKPWNYLGSRVAEGTFLAQRDGSILSIRSDPDALIESPDSRRDQDDIWQPMQTHLPEPGAPVTVVLKFLPEASK